MTYKSSGICPCMRLEFSDSRYWFLSGTVSSKWSKTSLLHFRERFCENVGFFFCSSTNGPFHVRSFTHSHIHTGQLPNQSLGRNSIVIAEVTDSDRDQHSPSRLSQSVYGVQLAAIPAQGHFAYFGATATHRNETAFFHSDKLGDDVEDSLQLLFHLQKREEQCPQRLYKGEG